MELDRHLQVVLGHHVLGNILLLLPTAVHSMLGTEAVLLTTIDLVRYEVLHQIFLLTVLVEDHLLFLVHFVFSHGVFPDVCPCLVFASKPVLEVPLVLRVVVYHLVVLLRQVMSQLVM